MILSKENELKLIELFIEGIDKHDIATLIEDGFIELTLDRIKIKIKAIVEGNTDVYLLKFTIEGFSEQYFLYNFSSKSTSDRVALLCEKAVNAVKRDVDYVVNRVIAEFGER